MSLVATLICNPANPALDSTIVDGAREVKIHGGWVPVRARVARIDSMSAHADASEIMRWLSGFTAPPAITHLVHGEPGALAALRARIEKEKQWPVHIAGYQERVPLSRYEDYAAAVDRIAAGEAGVLTREPVTLLEPTSGSTGGVSRITRSKRVRS